MLCRPLPTPRNSVNRIDAAVIATPTAHHHEVAEQLLSDGVHVLVEKPVTKTVAEANRLIALARRRGLVLQVGHVERFNPAWNAVVQHLARPQYIEAVRAGSYTFRSTDVSIVLDLMIHDLDLVLSLAAQSGRRRGGDGHRHFRPARRCRARHA